MDSRKSDVKYLRRKVMLNKLENNYLTVFDTAFKILFKDVYLDVDNSYISNIHSQQLFYCIGDEIVIEYSYDDIWYSYNDLWLPIQRIIIDYNKDFNDRMFLIEQMHLLFEIYLKDYFGIPEKEEMNINFPCKNTVNIWKARTLLK